MAYTRARPYNGMKHLRNPCSNRDRRKKSRFTSTKIQPQQLDFLYNEIFSFLFQRGVAGATVVRPVAGFGSHHRVHGTELGATSAGHMPVRIEFIESAERVDGLMPNLCELVTDGLIEAHETTVYKAVAKRDLPV